MIKKLSYFFLSLFLFLLPWQTIYITDEKFLNGSKWQSGTLGIFASEIVLWLSIILFFGLYAKNFFQKYKDQTLHFTWTRERLFLGSALCFLIFCFLSFFWAVDKNLSLQYSFYFLEALFLFLLICTFDKKDLLAFAFIFGAFFQSVLGIFQFFTQSTFSFKWLGLVAHPVFEAGTSVIVGDGVGRVMRAYGAFSHPNVFGGYLCLSLFLTTLLLLKYATKQNSWYTFFLSGAFVVQSIALFFTFSRSSAIAMIFFLICIFIFSFQKKKKEFLKILFLCVSLCVPVGVYYFPLIFTRVAHESSHEIVSTQERISGYKESFEIIKSSPIVGVGVGNYTAVLAERHPTWGGYLMQPVHSVPLLLLSELGIVGFLLFVGIVISYFRMMRIHSTFAVIFWILAVPFVLLSLFDHYLYSLYIGVLFWGVYFGLIPYFLPSRE